MVWGFSAMPVFHKHIERPRNNSVLLKGEFFRISGLVSVTPTLQTSFACLWLVGCFQQKMAPTFVRFNGVVCFVIPAPTKTFQKPHIYAQLVTFQFSTRQKPHQFSTRDLHTVWIGGTIKSCMSLATLVM